MKRVSSAEFKKHSGRYQDMALSEPVAITKHDRPAFVLLSFEEFEKLKSNSRRVLHVSQLSDKDLAAIAEAHVPEEYAHFDDELED